MKPIFVIIFLLISSTLLAQQSKLTIGFASAAVAQSEGAEIAKLLPGYTLTKTDTTMGNGARYLRQQYKGANGFFVLAYGIQADQLVLTHILGSYEALEGIYRHYFGELDAEKVKATKKSPPLKFERDGKAYRVQFQEMDGEVWVIKIV